MRPLPAEKGVDLDGFARRRDADFVRRAREWRPPLDCFPIKCALFVLLIAHVDHEEAVVMARQTLQALGELTEIARKDGVSRHLRLPRGVERPGRAGEMRSAANAARARRDDEPRLRILVSQNDLEPSEEFR